MPEAASTATKYLQNLWDDAEAVTLSARPLELLRYRSNLLGEDLIASFGQGADAVDRVKATEVGRDRRRHELASGLGEVAMSGDADTRHIRPVSASFQ